MKIYLAGALFSFAEREFNRILASELKQKIPGCYILLPQDLTKKIVKKTEIEFFEKIFTCCINSINESDLIISILDGPDVDSGTSLELGYAYANKKPIIGVRTDSRSLEERGVNLMISNVCTEFINYTDNSDDLDKLVNEIIKSINRLSDGTILNLI